MYSIIPLAGPDFFNPQYGIKPLFKVDGETLIKKILTSRKWIKDGEVKNENLIFVLKTSARTAECKKYLQQEFVNCKIVEISDFTSGALMSCLAATSLIKDFNAPLIFDLVDIGFKSDFSVKKTFAENAKLGAILPYFKSDNPTYSYADIDENGYVIATKEKKGWDFGKEKTTQGNASAGVYFFKNLSVFLTATIDSLENYESYHHKQNLFLCPAMNGIVKNGFKILPIEVFEIESFGLNFK
jgi:hypothetical protein